MIEKLSVNSLQEMSKTQKARELIVEELKNTKSSLQHKEIVKRLNNVKDTTTGELFFSNGNINGAFVSLNKFMHDLNVTKYKKDGGVYYEYITEDTDPRNIEEGNLGTLNELLDNLKECFSTANLLKSEILSGEFEKSDEVLNLISKINDLEFFVLQNEMK
jgi:hypothetical protein